MYLLTTSSAKTIKGEELGYLTSILYLNNRVNNAIFCPSATDHCRSSCLIGSGNLGLRDGVRATTERAKYYLNHREAFLDMLKTELLKNQRKADKKGMKHAIRLNGTSDIPWEAPKNGEMIQWINRELPTAHVYDYTKIVGRALPDYVKKLGLNYHITFSYSGQNLRQCLSLLQQGVNVAMVFDVKKGQSLPAEFQGYAISDADQHDLRFLDAAGTIAGLRYKHSFDRPDKGRKMIKDAKFLINLLQN